MNPNPDQTLNPFPWYQAMRESAPVYHDAERHIWHVFAFDDVQRALSDYAVFSSNFGGGGENPSNPLSSSLISSDPPRHRQLRSLVTQAFTPRTVARLEPRIMAIVNDLLDRAAPRGEMDIVSDFAEPLPVTVIAELLGIPTQDREQFKHWSDAVVTGGQSGGPSSSVAQRQMSAYFSDLMEQRRKAPADDLISALLEAQIDGRHLTQTELLGFCILLLVAGNETTTNLIGNAILCFDEYPDAMERLRAAPSLMPTAIEEVLRYRSPVQSMFRFTVAPTTLHGVDIPAGQPLLAWIGSANRDEAQFPNAASFDITRAPNRHIAFGYGIHFCLGAPLARLEGRIALTALLERLPDIQRVREATLKPIMSHVVYGVRNLPITFTPSNSIN